MVFRCYPGQHLLLCVILICVVTSTLLRIVTGCRVVTFLHNLAFGDLFIIKLAGKCGPQLLHRSMLEEVMLVVSS